VTDAIIPATGQYSVDGLARQYVPTPDEVLTWDEYIGRCAEVIGLARECFITLGELVEEGWQRFGHKSGSKRQFAGMLASALGCERSTIWKAWRLNGATLDLPQDVPPTLAYEVVSSTDDPVEQEERMDTVVAEGWTTGEVREAKRLLGSGAWDKWDRVRLALQRDGTLLARNGTSDWVTVGRLDVGNGTELVRAGVTLARHRLRV